MTVKYELTEEQVWEYFKYLTFLHGVTPMSATPARIYLRLERKIELTKEFQVLIDEGFIFNWDSPASYNGNNDAAHFIMIRKDLPAWVPDSLIEHIENSIKTTEVEFTSAIDELEPIENKEFKLKTFNILKSRMMTKVAPKIGSKVEKTAIPTFVFDTECLVPIKKIEIMGKITNS